MIGTMKLILITLKKTLFWSYERSSWQYDVLCVLILAFIFFTPNYLFHKDTTTTARAVPTNGLSGETSKRRVSDAAGAVASQDQPRLRSEKAVPAIE